MKDVYLVHHGVKGMKWGVRHDYRPTGIRSMLARRSNDKVDKSFKNWNKNTNYKQDAISLGKTRNEALRAYESNKNSETKSAYKSANKQYKKAYRKNTSYRKGQIRGEVGSDLSRKYLSAAKQVKKKLDLDPKNSALRKEYRSLMSKHDVERAKARKAPSVGAARSNRKAAYKRSMTMAFKSAAFAAGTAATIAALNKYGNVKINLSPDQIKKGIKTANNIRSFIY